MTEAELAYMAGIVDGEGTITLVKHWLSRNSAYPTYRPYLSVSQCDIRLPMWIKERFGGYIHNLGVPKNGHKQAFQWSVCGVKKVAPILKLFYPHLLLKKQQADIIIMFCDGHKTIRWLPDNEKKAISLGRMEMVSAVRKLNFRGIPPPETKRPGAERLCDSPTPIEKQHGEVVRNGNPVKKVTLAMVTEVK